MLVVEKAVVLGVVGDVKEVTIDCELCGNDVVVVDKVASDVRGRSVVVLCAMTVIGNKTRRDSSEHGSDRSLA